MRDNKLMRREEAWNRAKGPWRTAMELSEGVGGIGVCGGTGGCRRWRVWLV